MGDNSNKWTTGSTVSKTSNDPWYLLSNFLYVSNFSQFYLGWTLMNTLSPTRKCWLVVLFSTQFFCMYHATFRFYVALWLDLPFPLVLKTCIVSFWLQNCPNWYANCIFIHTRIWKDTFSNICDIDFGRGFPLKGDIIPLVHVT